MLREATQEKQGELTTREQEKILDTISPNFKRYFYARELHNTRPADAFNHTERGTQHPSTDGTPESQWRPNDHMDSFPDPRSASPERQFDREELERAVEYMLEGLTKRESAVLKMRFGIGIKDFIFKSSKGSEDSYMTLEDVGKVFDVNRERIRQIESKALRKLRHPSFSEDLRIYSAEHSETIQVRIEDAEIAEMENAAFEQFLSLNAE